jgi:hypothetical protein
MSKQCLDHENPLMPIKRDLHMVIATATHHDLPDEKVGRFVATINILHKEFQDAAIAFLKDEIERNTVPP